MDEFSIISKYFKPKAGNRSDVILGIGDDCALLKQKQGEVLAVTVDTMVSGVHFLDTFKAYDLGHKAVANGLSDLASMGAVPAWVTLAITLSKPDDLWLSDFSAGFADTSSQFSLQLIGGNTTKGPLSITTSLYGFLPEGKALRRDGAGDGDLIYVSGTLGDAGLALSILFGEVSPTLISSQYEYIMGRLSRPTPRVNEGVALLDIASSAIDISDGLAADLKHILECSDVGATIYVDDLPMSSILKNLIPENMAFNLALSAGDDYELCVTIPQSKHNKFLELIQSFDCNFKLIGKISAQKGLRIKYNCGDDFGVNYFGYEHRW